MVSSLFGVTEAPRQCALRIRPPGRLRGGSGPGQHRCLWAAVLAVALLFAAGCQRFERMVRRQADRAAYDAIAAKQQEAFGETTPFSIDPQTGDRTRSLLDAAPRLDGLDDTFTTPTHVISLSQALAIAVVNNREYRTRREDLFNSALALTQSRWDFGPIYSASGSASLTRSDLGHDTPAGATVERFGTRGFSLGVRRILATGAQVSLDFSHNFIRYLTNDPRPSASNSLSLSVIQPLLRGAGPLVAHEPLRQSERDMLYAVREFRRYRQDFSIDVAQRYYGLINTQDQVRNARTNLHSAMYNWQRLQRFNEGGYTSRIEVDQARQAVLEAEAGLIRAQKNYGRQLDLFKVFLDLPLDLDIHPDPAELDALTERGLLRPDMALREATALALENRLDLANLRDRAEDSDRRARIAIREFLPNLDFGWQYNTTKSDDEDRVKLDFRDNTNAWSLDLALPTDWTPRRNSYRGAVIASDRAHRTVDEAEDAVLLEVRDLWRSLDELRINYSIQLESVRLAESRVRHVNRLLQRGRASARDLLEAQDALLLSRNAMTSALVSHTIERLRFWQAIERFEVDPAGGEWAEGSLRDYSTEGEDPFADAPAENQTVPNTGEIEIAP